MDLGKKYLDISVKKENEVFGLFNVRSYRNQENFDDTPKHWMFNEQGLRNYDDNGDALFDANGKQLFDIGDDGIKKPLGGKEKFSGLNDNKFMKQS